MSPIFTKPRDPQELQKPLYERFQDYIFNLDIGGGATLFRMGMFGLLVAFVVLFYTGTQFYGLRDPEAMDTGQLARNLWRGRGYRTLVLRPVEMWHLISLGRPAVEGQMAMQPELFTPPMYPLVLAGVFKLVNPNFEITTGTQTLRADRLMMVVSWVWFLVGMGLLYALCRELFDQRVAVMTVLMYLLCDPLLDFATSGLSMNFMTVLFVLVAFGLVKAEKWQAAGRPAVWVNGALAASALAVGLGTLTAYAFACVLVPLVVYVAVSFPKRWYLRAGMCVAVFALVLAPWVARNWKVSHTLFGLSKYEVAEGTLSYAKSQVERTYLVDNLKFRFTDLARKTLVNARNLYQQQLKDVGAGYLIAFFIASLLHRYRREETFRLRRLVFWSMLMCVLWLSVVGPPARNFLTVFLPPVIMYGVSFFYVMFERLQFRTRLLRMGMVSLFGLMNALPFVFAILPPQTKLPYPPYDAGVATVLGKMFREEETLASDIPWAVAWYADRATVWLPFDQGDFFAVNDGVRAINGVYLTQATLKQQGVLEMITGYQRFWLSLYDLSHGVPPAFPLQFPRPLTPDGQQILLSNRPR